MELRRQYDYFDLIDGTQALIYTIGEHGTRTERGEITALSLSVTRSVETVNSLGQDFAGKKPGLPECTASFTARVGQEQSQWARLALGPPTGRQRRRRVERFEIVAFMHDREVEHAGTQKIICHGCWVSEITVPLAEVDTRQLTVSGTIQMEWAEFMDHFQALGSGITTPAPQPSVLG